MENSKIIKYYSHTDSRWLYLEVNDEIYRYFDSLKKQRRENRKSRQRIFEEGHIYYDAYEGFELLSSDWTELSGEIGCERSSM